jgi:phosphonate transport system substrate-binding protein
MLPSPDQLPETVLKPDPTKPVLRVGLGAVSSPRANLRNYTALLEYLGRELGRRVIVVQRHTYAEMNELIQAGKVDMAFICTFPYIKGQAEFGLELIAAPEVDGKAEYHAYFLVPSGSSATSLLDLRGGIYAFSDPLSLTGYIVPSYLLRQAGQTAEKLFRNHIYTYSHDNSILAVADRLVDGAHVNSLVYNAAVIRDPSLAGRVKIVDTHGPFGSPPVVVRPDLDPDIKASIQRLLLGLDEIDYGREMLREIAVDRFVVPDMRLYDEARRVAGHALGQ